MHRIIIYLMFFILSFDCLSLASSNSSKVENVQEAAGNEDDPLGSKEQQGQWGYWSYEGWQDWFSNGIGARWDAAIAPAAPKTSQTWWEGVKSRGQELFNIVSGKSGASSSPSSTPSAEPSSSPSSPPSAEPSSSPRSMPGKASAEDLHEPVVTIIKDDGSIKMSGSDFTRVVVSPSFNKTKEALEEPLNARNINIKLMTMSISNDALSW